MDDTRSGSTYTDDDIDFDLVLDDDFDIDEPSSDAAAPRRSRKRGSNHGYRPMRMRTAPNWSRIAAAAFIAGVFLLLIGFGVSSWMDHRKQAAFQQYFDSVTEITSQSNSEGQELDGLLAQNGGVDRTQLVARLAKLEQRAAALVRDANEVSVPDALSEQQASFVTVLEYRRAGFESLRKGMTGALVASNQDDAAAGLADAMARLLAADVVYADSYVAPARTVLTKQDISGISIPESALVKQRDAVAPKGMKLILERLRSGRVAAKNKRGKVQQLNDGKVHGGELANVTITPSGQELAVGGITEISGSDQLGFEVSFTNQGEVQETRIPVTITLSSDSSDNVVLTGEIESVDPGQTGSVRIPVPEVPNFGTTFTMKVQAGPVPGEKTIGNNAASYKVTFKL